MVKRLTLPKIFSTPFDIFGIKSCWKNVSKVQQKKCQQSTTFQIISNKSIFIIKNLVLFMKFQVKRTLSIKLWVYWVNSRIYHYTTTSLSSIIQLNQALEFIWHNAYFFGQFHSPKLLSWTVKALKDRPPLMTTTW